MQVAQIIDLLLLLLLFFFKYDDNFFVFYPTWLIFRTHIHTYDPVKAEREITKTLNNKSKVFLCQWPDIPAIRSASYKWGWAMMHEARCVFGI